MKNFFQKLNDVMARAALSELGVDSTEDDRAEKRFVLLESGITKVPRTEPGAFRKSRVPPKAMGSKGSCPMIVSSVITSCAT